MFINLLKEGRPIAPLAIPSFFEIKESGGA